MNKYPQNLLEALLRNYIAALLLQIGVALPFGLFVLAKWRTIFAHKLNVAK